MEITAPTQGGIASLESRQVKGSLITQVSRLTRSNFPDSWKGLHKYLNLCELVIDNSLARSLFSDNNETWFGDFAWQLRTLGACFCCELSRMWEIWPFSPFWVKLG